MLENVRSNRDIFERLYRARNDMNNFTRILEKMTRSQTTAVAEVALNCLYGAIGFAQGKRRRLQVIKPVLKSISTIGIPPKIRKKICLSHVDELAAFIEIVYKNLQSLIWKDQEATKIK